MKNKRPNGLIAATVSAILFIIVYAMGSDSNPHKGDIKSYMQEIIQLAVDDDLETLATKVDYKRITTQNRHGYSPERLVDLLKKINLDESNVIITPLSKDNTCTMRVQGTYSIDFQMELKEGQCVLVGVNT